MRNIYAASLSLSLLPGLAACVSAEQQQRQFEAACAGYGFERGTTDFARCMQRESLAERYGPAYGPPRFDFGWYDGNHF
ncbi:MAG TPA: hypothetical protein VF502_13420 [Stellaceae bacterium]